MRRKRNIVGCLMFCMMLAVAGCGGKKEHSTKEKQEETGKSIQKVTTEGIQATQVVEQEDTSETTTEEYATEETTEPAAEQQTEQPVTSQEMASPKEARPSTCGKLKLNGNQLSNQNNQPVQLRGISTHGIAWFPDYINQECLNDWSGFGANVVRFAMYTSEYGGYCNGGDRENLKNMIINGVNFAKNADMYAIVDWHILSDGNPQTYKEDAKAFFSEMSAKFSGYDNVIYEICNEPNGGTSWEDVKAYAEEVIPVIRANAPESIIIVGTPTWSQEVDKALANPVTGYDNIMYSLHFYASTHREDLRNKMMTAHNQGLPIFVSEYGLCDASGNGAIDAEQSRLWFEAMDNQTISYVAWNLSNKDESSSLIQSSCDKKSGFEYNDLSEEGKMIYDMLSK